MKSKNVVSFALSVMVAIFSLTSCQTQGDSSVTGPSIENPPSDVDYDQFSHPFYYDTEAYTKDSNDNDMSMKQHVAMFTTMSGDSIDTNRAVFLLAPTYNGDNDRKDLTAWIMDNNQFQGNDRMGEMVLNRITGIQGNEIDGIFDPQDYGDHLWEDLGKNLPKTASIYNFDINKEINYNCYLIYNSSTYTFSHYLVSTLDSVNNYYSNQISSMKAGLYVKKRLD